MTDQMPQVNAEFGTTPVIEFPTPEAPKGLKVVELTEDVADDNTVCVNDRHKVVLAAQLGGQCGSDFSAAHNDNFHVLSLQCKSILRKIVKTRQAAS